MGVVSARDAAAGPKPPRADPPEYVYRLGTAYRITVADYDDSAHPYAIRWREAGVWRFQVLAPAGEWDSSDDLDLDLDPDSKPKPEPSYQPGEWNSAAASKPDLSYEPDVLLWPGSRAAVFVAQRPSGVYGVRAPLVYVLRNHHWRLANPDPEQQAFTDRGAFFMKRDRLYVWDYAMDDEHAHRAPQRYWLKTFRLSQSGKLSQIGKKMTRRLYPDIGEVGEVPPPEQVPSRFDPLREFGMRWRWWGDRSLRTPSAP